MTYTVVKEKLHSYIEQADQKKIKAIYTLLENDIEQEQEQDRFTYNEETLQMLEKVSEDAFAGKTKTYTLEESMASIKKHRKKNGL